MHLSFNNIDFYHHLLCLLPRLRLMQADIVYARGRARMGRSQHSMDACRAAVLSAGGIVTAAALTCITEMELQARQCMIE